MNNQEQVGLGIALAAIFKDIEPEKIEGGSPQRYAWMEAMLSIFAYLIEYVGKASANSFYSELIQQNNHEESEVRIEPYIAIGINHEEGVTFSRTITEIPLDDNKALSEYMRFAAGVGSDIYLDEILVVVNGVVESRPAI